MTISEKLRELRESRNLSKRQLTEAIGINYSTYNNWEAGTREPGSSHLILFAKFYNVSIDYILGYSGPEVSEDRILDLACHGLGHDEKLTPEERERIKMAIRIALTK